MLATQPETPTTYPFAVAYWTRGVKGVRLARFRTEAEATEFAKDKRCWSRPAFVQRLIKVEGGYAHYEESCCQVAS